MAYDDYKSTDYMFTFVFCTKEVEDVETILYTFQSEFLSIKFPQLGQSQQKIPNQKRDFAK